jgi:hypothetical protein
MSAHCVICQQEFTENEWLERHTNHWGDECHAACCQDCPRRKPALERKAVQQAIASGHTVWWVKGLLTFTLYEQTAFHENGTIVKRKVYATNCLGAARSLTEHLISLGKMSDYHWRRAQRGEF